MTTDYAANRPDAPLCDKGGLCSVNGWLDDVNGKSTKKPATEGWLEE
ncbi:hypothetical protein ND920_02940 [Vibrio ordalii]|nr:hypothetical protein [Vibrio ordalii]MCS0350572.1 hypothetical protein [Vibrio ordalii]